MSRDPSGIYTYPDGTRGVPDTTIFSARYNTFLDDLATTLNTKLPVNMGGTNADDVVEARTNLKAEASTVQVTNYDTHVFESGSFYSLAGATGAPNSTNVFCGIAYVGTDPGQVVNLEARMLADTVVPARKYFRQKFGGVWGAWSIDASGSFVAKGGDTMTGDLSITKASPSLVLNKGDAAADQSAIYGYRNGVGRWAFLMGQGTAETGGNVGSDFLLLRYGDAGNFLDVPIHVNRATGNVTFSQTASAINGRLWGASDGSPVFKGAVNTITNPMTINGNLAGNWVCSFINNSAAASAGGIYTQVANDANMSIGVLNAAGNAWGHQFFGNGTSSASSSITCPNFYGTLNGNITGNAAYATSAGSASSASSANSVNTGTVTVNGDYVQSTGDLYLRVAGGGEFTKFRGDGGIEPARGIRGRAGYNGPGGGNLYNFNWNSTLEAWIDTSNWGSVLNVHSDYRMKADVVTLDSKWDAVKALRPIRYTASDWAPYATPDGKERWGFLAHELQETLLPTASSGHKDCEGAPQQPNLMVVIAALTKALQEAMARIEALEAAA